MSSRSRTEPPRDPTDEDAPPLILDGDPFKSWMGEVTIWLERLAARMKALEKACEQFADVVKRSTDVSVQTAGALDRLAKAQENANQLERERAAAAAKLDRERERSKERWLGRFWESQAVQILLVGLVVSILQFMGLGYFAANLEARIVKGEIPGTIGSATIEDAGTGVRR